MEFVAAFIIGLAGSFHCIGMCGPIALSLSSGNSRNFGFILKRGMYNTGRIVSYASLGFIFGFAGDRISLFGLQRWLSVLIGSLLILSVVMILIKVRLPGSGRLYKIVSPVFSKTYSSLKSKNTFPSMFVIGAANGLLPCGFVYAGLGGALAIGGALDGALYMALFGLGTIPVMLGLTVFGNVLSSNFRSRMTKLIPVMVILLGVLFVMRGLNLGIPYLSPSEAVSKSNTTNEMICK